MVMVTLVVVLPQDLVTLTPVPNCLCVTPLGWKGAPLIQLYVAVVSTHRFLARCI